MDARRNDRWTPLHLASSHGKPEIVQVLLDHGANPNAEDKFFMTPLHNVAVGQYESQEHGARVAQLLLQCGADVNAQDSQCETPLHLASTSGKLEIVRVLLEHATVKDDRGQNPSHPVVEGKSLSLKNNPRFNFFF